jgi:hypothetical protein
VDERSDDDVSVDNDAAAEAADAALQCDMGPSDNSNNINQGSSAALPYADPWAEVDWSDETYVRDTAFALRAIAADFPRFELGAKVPQTEFFPHTRYWPIEFYYRGTQVTKFCMDFDNFDYGISFAPFCTPEFLPSLSAEDHKRLMDTAAMRESFRCFFLHLAVELGVHPVALQVIARLPRVAAQTFDSRPLPLFLFVCSTCAESDAQHFQS